MIKRKKSLENLGHLLLGCLIILGSCLPATNIGAQLATPLGSPLGGPMSNPLSGSIDTLYATADSFAIDPNAGSNPFMQNGPRNMDDPGGPGSGGGGFDPPPDAAPIPLDGGVGALLLAGAAAGVYRRRNRHHSKATKA